MSAEPQLSVSVPDGATTAVALVLHGGRANSHMRTRATQLAVVRMVPFVRRLRVAGAPYGLAVATVRYRYRGWNGAERSPVPDTEWALAQLRERLGDVPVALVGHSMGGRTALYAAGSESVRVVVGLAPWVEAGDPVEPLRGRDVLIVHGDADRMTSPGASAELARRAAGVAASVSFVSVRGERHAMLRRAGVWHSLAAGYVTGVLYGTTPSESVDGAAAKILVQALGGDTPLTV